MLLADFVAVTIVISMSTLLGALLVILFRDKCVKRQRLLLIAEALIMLCLSAELTIQGLLSDWVKAVIGFIIGVVLMIIVHRLIPHTHSVIKELSILVIAGFLVHEIPEGISLGVSSVLNPAYGLITAFLIGLQNFPEGAMIALPMVLAKHPNSFVIKMVLMTHVFFAVAAAAAFIFLPGFPYNDILLTIAAGAMTYLVYEEIKISYNKTLA